MTVAPQRRKGATYGKTSRRVYPTDEFLKPKTTHASWDTGRDSDLSGQISNTRKDGPDSITNVYDFDILSEDEITLQHPASIVTTVNKRRKLSPSAGKLHGPRKANASLAKGPAFTEAKPGSLMPSVARPSYIQGRAVGDSRMPEQSLPHSNSEHTSNERQDLVNKNEISRSSKTSHQPPGLHRNKTPPRATEKPAATMTTPGRNRTGQALPVTPPSSGQRSPRSCVTPRQRDMWQSLLDSGEPSGESPGQLRMSTLHIATKDGSLPGRLSIGTPKHTAKRAEASRKRRLIDVLNPDGCRPLPACSSLSSKTTGAHECKDLDVDKNNKTRDVDGRTPEKPRELHPDAVLNSGQAVYLESTATDTNSTRVNSTKGARVTYAQQRSYLSDCAVARDVSSGPRTSALVQTQVPNVDLPSTLYQSIDDFDLPDDDVTQAGVMRSARELRNAGGNARLLVELESLLEELTENVESPTHFRSALLRLVSRLKESSATCLFAEKALDLRFMDLPLSGRDVMSSALSAMVFLHIMTNSPSPVLVSRLNAKSVVTLLIELLHSGKNLKQVALDREFKFSRAARQEVGTLCDLFLKVIAVYPPRPSFLSSRSLGLQCLRLIAEWKRENGETSLSLDGPHIRQIILTSMARKHPNTELQGNDLFNLGLAISIIAGLSFESPNVEIVLLEGEIFDRLSGALISLPSNETELRALTYKLYIDLTQSSHKLREAFATKKTLLPMLVQSRSYFSALTAKANTDLHEQFNLTILALMCLINITETSRTARGVLMDCYEDSSKSPSIFHVLVDCFKASSAKVANVYSVEEVTRNIPLGYLSVMLGFVCLDQSARDYVKMQLAGDSLEPLLEVIREFTKHYQAIDKTGKDDRHMDEQPRFADRIQTLVLQLKR